MDSVENMEQWLQCLDDMPTPSQLPHYDIDLSPRTMDAILSELSTQYPPQLQAESTLNLTESGPSIPSGDHLLQLQEKIDELQKDFSEEVRVTQLRADADN
ncbi:uncharacterized protein CIMG_08727 [Coccidioides immitis RS]|uniref:Uncharacterized protein n=1 Tax=Coccidioides immitis (strain RS) TaxID=246410 RepID=A0A0E1RX27_COCIM|nr:uncharacterized protein CIMG_08727 [Coccidioides immitis RS]EAS29981.1 hypothetical protein CIMG_08727 [Coccidioides immitis RS]